MNKLPQSSLLGPLQLFSAAFRLRIVLIVVNSTQFRWHIFTVLCSLRLKALFMAKSGCRWFRVCVIRIIRITGIIIVGRIVIIITVVVAADLRNQIARVRFERVRITGACCARDCGLDEFVDLIAQLIVDGTDFLQNCAQFDQSIDCRIVFNLFACT